MEATRGSVHPSWPVAPRESRVVIVRACSHGLTRPDLQIGRGGSHGTKLQLDSGYGALVPTFSTVLDCRYCKPDLLPINPTFYFKIQLSATCLLVPLKYKL